MIHINGLKMEKRLKIKIIQNVLELSEWPTDNSLMDHH